MALTTSFSETGVCNGEQVGVSISELTRSLMSVMVSSKHASWTASLIHFYRSISRRSSTISSNSIREGCNLCSKCTDFAGKLLQNDIITHRMVRLVFLWFYNKILMFNFGGCDLYCGATYTPANTVVSLLQLRRCSFYKWIMRFREPDNWHTLWNVAGAGSASALNYSSSFLWWPPLFATTEAEFQKSVPRSSVILLCYMCMSSKSLVAAKWWDA